ncbi:YiiX/YebB-like N1pC/P60 family cysteine hydrolase [Anaeromyxobacter oryzae]|uniref:Uncharacterized protein n=1 Tax=Anaeromyxobacter oryzae TaxID=2918170 RepID=A0ABN6MZF6_9BACT|nr:YiiX/YebB-like N1pC/P60 family cysteine hydrolase [Anaeromyxobacter oryzae]BDG06308.1 hypothetical protein AMOR_53040 [Anaeromyxobacter oryzae]
MGSRTGRRPLRIAGGVFAALAAAYGVLLLPDPEPPPPPPAQDPAVRAFAWNQDASWDRLEERWAHARRAGCGAVAPGVSAGLRELEVRIDRLRSGAFAADAPILAEAEQAVFELGPRVGACPERLPEYLDAVVRLRDAVKRQSERWSMADRATREALYRLLYGGRAAVEEVILQVPPGAAPPALTPGTDEPSATPAASILGVKVHSGDILVSRGGAPISALIARGNDFPGNFSHIALVHVDAATGVVSIVESHIERGVTVSTPEDYLRDTKLRIMVLRLRADLPAIAADPMLPHRAATAALENARTRRIPYDFAMDREDATRLFCSEVAADGYRRRGVALWMGLSHISSPGLQRWLAALGVRHFETLEPSDLEYDPQLRIVAEWRDPDTLRKDHYDSAVTQAMLDAAVAGAPLRYDRWKLPFARVVKGYSVLLNALGAVGPVPKGMSAAAGLRSSWYAARHAELRARLERRADQHRAAAGYPPPFWRLVRMAREELEALGTVRPG